MSAQFGLCRGSSCCSLVPVARQACYQGVAPLTLFEQRVALLTLLDELPPGGVQAVLGFH